MKKFLIIFTVLILVTGCGNTSSKDTKKESTGYEINIKGKDISVGSEFSIIKDLLGEDFEYQEIESCAFEGKDSIYTYDNLEIYNYHDKDIEKIYTITLLDDTISTKEGIKIGSTIVEMKKTYGHDYEETIGAYVYTKDNTILTFITEDDIVTSIEYKLNID